MQFIHIDFTQLAQTLLHSLDALVIEEILCADIILLKNISRPLRTLKYCLEWLFTPATASVIAGRAMLYCYYTAIKLHCYTAILLLLLLLLRLLQYCCAAVLLAWYCTATCNYTATATAILPLRLPC
jgi:putative effector of murein hydrolase LrgA (UPF0299 family)